MAVQDGQGCVVWASVLLGEWPDGYNTDGYENGGGLKGVLWCMDVLMREDSSVQCM